ncbi:MAG: hypothetical protein AB7I79_15190 [Rhizobiaceae bacterium]
MEFQLEYRGNDGIVRRRTLHPSQGLAMLDALPPGCEARVIAPGGQVWSVDKTRAALIEAVGNTGVALSSPLEGSMNPERRPAANPCPARRRLRSGPMP